MFDANEIRAATFVRHVEVHDTIRSTNDRAAELARWADIELPALVVTRIQTAGRGRGKNAWWSTDGALTFSLLVDTKTIGVAPEKWPQLSLTTAVAVCDALQQEAPQAGIGIKWPNDVLIDGKKICGILIESPGGSAPAKDCVIIGIGINVNNPCGDETYNLWNAIALCEATSCNHKLDLVLLNVLRMLGNRLEQLKIESADLPAAWQQRCLLSGATVQIDTGGQTVEGKLTGLAGDGAAVIRTATGLQQIYSGTLRALA